jgi:WD40 repeat protein
MPKLLTDLPADVVQHIVVRFTLAHHIARAAPTCKVVSVAVRNAIKERKFSSEVVTLAGHASLLNCLAAADSRVITGSEDKTVKVWRDGACEHTIEAHTESITAVAVLPGGARFVSIGYDFTAKLWTLGALERTWELHGEAYCVAALPDGVHFVVGVGYDEDEDEDSYEVRLYHVDGTLVHAFKGHTGYLQSVAVTPDGQHIISGSADKLVKAWSVASKSLVTTCAGHTDWVYAVAAMPDGQRILSGGSDNTVRVWLLNGTHQNTFELHSHLVTALVALPDNQHALSASMDKTVKLFNVNDGDVLRTFKHHTNVVRCLALLPDGLRFVSGSHDNTARIAYHGLAP